ncbi:MAG: hypothetical protein ACEQSF_04185 [Solirubrobacteraceae bacterium]
MKKKIIILSLLSIASFVNAQDIKLDENKIQDNLDNLSRPQKEILTNSFEEEVDSNTTSNFKSGNNVFKPVTTNSSNYQVPRRMVLRSIIRRGSFKIGTSFFSAQQLIAGPEIDLFTDSEVLDTSIPFVKRTGVPYLNAELEYTILDNVGIGGFLGYTRSENSNRKSDGPRESSISQGFIFGLQATTYNPASNFLYIPIYLEMNFEKGTVNYFDGQKRENFVFQRFRVGSGVGLTIAVNDRVQFEFRGLDVSYNSVDFAQTKKTDISGNQILRSDQKIERNTLSFAANPRVRLLAQILTFGREKDKK